ncbi:MAG: COX15/CtaA family protein [Opitutales bacterium]
MEERDPILLWLRCVCASVVIILIVGGITRLTGSGLSMVDWRPVMGILPPLSDADWEEVFGQYREFPEYKLLNKGMSLDEFKGIFFWEYLHRVLGRVVGLLCLLPYLWFLWKKRLDGSLKVRGLGLVLLVAAQGLMGWYMVKSGLARDPEVSHYRLAAHLGLAFAVFGLAWWMILNLRTGVERPGGSRRLRLWATGLLVLLCLQMTYGAFTSGLKAGYGFNTFPKMEGDWAPDALFTLTPYWKNFVEDRFSVQFIHRWLGTSLVLATMGFGWFAIRSGNLSPSHRRRLNWILGLAFTQFCLGVATLVLVVPIPLAILHQLVALFLFSAFLALIHSLPKRSLAK